MKLDCYLCERCGTAQPIQQAFGNHECPWCLAKRGHYVQTTLEIGRKLGTALLIAARSNNPHVQFIFEEFEDAKARGYIIPGWYFWDETQSHVHGPYESESETIKALDAYALSLNPIET